MKPIERFEELNGNSLDQILFWIQIGKIKSGSKAIKVKNKNITLKELIENANRESGKWFKVLQWKSDF